jgi:sialate O-acetylesterase
MNHRSRLELLALLLVLATSSVATADVRLAAPFGDHAVLQCDMPVPVWGWAEPGARVVVTVDGGAQTQSTTAPDDGRWQVTLDPMPPGGPVVLKATNGAEAVARDVLIGEVWLASGQSNMQWTVAQAGHFEREREAADYPRLRMLTIERRPAEEPEQTCRGQWNVCSPATVGHFSAVGYYFGRALHRELDVPVGIVHASWGATPIETWISRPWLAGTPEIAEHLPQWDQVRHQKDRAARLFNGMIAPLVPYAIRGVIWYQGETNALYSTPQYGHATPDLYGPLLAGLITDWRQRWNQGDFPLIVVQLPEFMTPQQRPVEPSEWVTVREQMHSVLARVPNVGMAVTLGLGETDDIHPPNKQDVGRRLASWALANTYGQDRVAGGPLLKRFEKKGDRFVLTFDQIGSGLQIEGERLEGFAIAGPDKQWIWADAEITAPDTVVVSSTQVDDPVAVRYAWANHPRATLVNSAGLPAAPLRTDDWPR